MSQKFQRLLATRRAVYKELEKEIITTGKSGNIREEEELELAKIADNMKTSSLSQS